MLQEDFKRLVVDLNEFYGKDDLPPKKKADKWFNKMERIPSECREFLYDRITDEYSRFPENLPKAAWKFFDEWKTEHPEKFKTKEFMCVQEACDLGMIGFFKPEGQNKLWIPYRAKCGHCRELPQSWSGETYTVDQIRANGWIVADTHGCREVEILNRQLRSPFDATKYRKHFGGKGITGEGYERLSELARRAMDDLDTPF